MRTNRKLVSEDIPKNESHSDKTVNGNVRRYQKSNPPRLPARLDISKKKVNPKGANAMATGRNHSIQFSRINS
jgi:hypothetical protein